MMSRVAKVAAGRFVGSVAMDKDRQWCSNEYYIAVGACGERVSMYLWLSRGDNTNGVLAGSGFIFTPRQNDPPRNQDFLW